MELDGFDSGGRLTQETARVSVRAPAVSADRTGETGGEVGHWTVRESGGFGSRYSDKNENKIKKIFVIFEHISVFRMSVGLRNAPKF